MRKYFFFSSMTLIMFMILGGCSTTSDYCCTSNDQCGETAEGLHSCSDDTCGKCVLVESLTITPATLTDAAVGQSNYSVELTVSGGNPPYKWGDPTKGEKLAWLTLVPDENNNDKAWLKNAIYNGQPVLPTEPVEELPIKITATDHTKPGTDPRRGDNKGAILDSNIKIKDCYHKCKRVDDTDDNFTAEENDKKCDNNTSYTCTSYYPSANCVKWDNPEDCHAQCQSDNISCCVNECSKLDIRCLNGQIDNCTVNTLGCLAWTKYQDCDPKECNPDASSCKNCTNECQKSGDHQCSDDKTMVKTCEFNPVTGCLVWAPYEQCQDDPSNHCLLTGCTNGQCAYRYTIQTNNVDTVNVEEVYDAQTNLYWKRQIEPGTYTWEAANGQCSKSYHLPSIYHSYANPSKAELDTLLEEGHGAPYINTCAFPNMPNCNVSPRCTSWSLSGYVGNTNVAWFMDFKSGYVSNTGIANAMNVRCVRAGP
jgi:hypothetical protein